MKKKLCEPLSVFLSAVLIIGLLNFPAGAAGIVVGGECGGNGNNVTWTLDRDGLLTVSGTGAMYDYRKESDVPWYSYRSQIKKAEIQSGVTTVGQNAFRDCANLESVVLPAQGLQAIQNVSFHNCVALKEITVPNGNETVIPNGVTTIGESAFGFCALTKISLPASVQEIGERVFYRCSALTEIQVDAGNANYSAEDGILFDKVATEDTGGEEGTGEGQTAPTKTTLVCYPAAKEGTEYAVPDGIQTIGSYAFHSALNLTKVTAPEGVETIEPYAFAYSALGGDEEGVKEGLDLPKSLTLIGEAAFYECRGLSTTDDDGLIKATGIVNFTGSRQQWNEIDIKDKNTCLTNANIMFGDMKQDNIIASGECGDKGSNAVWSLNDKGDFLISGTGAMSNYRSASNVPWANYVASGATGAQDLRSQIKTVTIEGDTVENGVVTKSGITNVGDYAFSDCENLTTVTLPASLKTVGTRAFSNCVALTSVNLSATAATAIDDYAFNGTTTLQSVVFPETLETIGNQAFSYSGLKAVTIPANVKSIGDWAFRRSQLTTFTMAPLARNDTPHKSAVIGAHALANCESLTTVNFTANLASLGEYALADCGKLTNSSNSSTIGVWIPENVSNIGQCAFHGCESLTAVNVDKANLTYSSVDGMLMNKDETCIFFYPPERIGLCVISDSVTSVVDFAFDGAKQLKDVSYLGTQSQWDKMIEEKWISPVYNDPLLNANITCEGVEPDDSEKATYVDSSDITTSGDVRQLQIVVHCGLETFGAQVFCAVYDEDGRFLRIALPDKANEGDAEAEAAEDEETEQELTLTPGQDTKLTYTLDESVKETGQIRLLILDGYNVPCCECEIPDISG